MSTIGLENQQVPGLRPIAEATEQAVEASNKALETANTAVEKTEDAIKRVDVAIETADAASTAAKAAQESLEENIGRIDEAVESAAEAKEEVKSRANIKTIGDNLELTEDGVLNATAKGDGVSVDDFINITTNAGKRLFSNYNIDAVNEPGFVPTIETLEGYFRFEISTNSSINNDYVWNSTSYNPQGLEPTVGARFVLNDGYIYDQWKEAGFPFDEVYGIYVGGEKSGDPSSFAISPLKVPEDFDFEKMQYYWATFTIELSPGNYGGQITTEVTPSATTYTGPTVLGYSVSYDDGKAKLYYNADFVEEVEAHAGDYVVIYNEKPWERRVLQPNGKFVKTSVLPSEAELRKIFTFCINSEGRLDPMEDDRGLPADTTVFRTLEEAKEHMGKNRDLADLLGRGWTIPSIKLDIRSEEDLAADGNTSLYTNDVHTEVDKIVVHDYYQKKHQITFSGIVVKEITAEIYWTATDDDYVRIAFSETELAGPKIARNGYRGVYFYAYGPHEVSLFANGWSSDLKIVNSADTEKPFYVSATGTFDYTYVTGNVAQSRGSDIPSFPGKYVRVEPPYSGNRHVQKFSATNNTVYDITQATNPVTFVMGSNDAYWGNMTNSYMVVLDKDSNPALFDKKPYGNATVLLPRTGEFVHNK